MSKPQKITIRPSRAMKISKEQLNQQMTNSKRRVSAAKGEMNDALNDVISREFGGIGMMCNQLIDLIQELEADNAVFLKKLKDAGIQLSPEDSPKPPQN